MQNSRRGGVLVALLLTCLVIVCLAVFGGLYIARHVNVETTARNNGADVSIDTPAGHLTVRTHDEAHAGISGVPVYPGARINKHSGGDALVEWNSNDRRADGGLLVSASESVTDDPVDKVVDYYRAQLPNWIVSRDRNGGVELKLREGGYKRVVAIRAQHDGTHIGVASAGEPASN